jgi:hypothetical protein
MIYLCRFRQRNRLIEIPSEYYHQQNGISHENLKDLISKKFFLLDLKNSFLFSIFSSRISITTNN